MTRINRGISPQLHEWLLSISDHVVADDALRRREFVRRQEHYNIPKNDRRGRRKEECKICEGSGVEFDEEHPGNYARVCTQCNGEGWVVK